MPNRCLRIIRLAAILFLGFGTRSAWAQGEIFVTSSGNDSVSVFQRTASGNTPPLRTIVGASTGLSNPIGIAVDTVHGEIVAANININAITVHARLANGNAPPLRTIVGASTGLANPRGLALDRVNNEIIVANGNNSSVTVYSRTANGNVAPLRTIMGGNTGLQTPVGLALDLVNNEIAVVNRNLSFSIYSVTVYSRTASGNVFPLRTIIGNNTGLSGPFGIDVDTLNNEIFVTNDSTETVTVHSRTADGDVAPLRKLTGGSTGLSAPEGVAVDTVNNELVVANVGNLSVKVYPRTASGNASPLRTLQGAATGLNPTLLVVTPPIAAQFFTVTPCRVVDTRQPVGSFGGPALAHLGTRNFVLASQCSIPSGATSVAVNIAVTQPTNGPGFLTLYPGGTARPLFSSINYSAGQTRANNAIVPVGAFGDIDVYCAQGGGTVHFILDVNGYFQ